MEIEGIKFSEGYEIDNIYALQGNRNPTETNQKSFNIFEFVWPQIGNFVENKSMLNTTVKFSIISFEQGGGHNGISIIYSGIAGVNFMNFFRYKSIFVFRN